MREELYNGILERTARELRDREKQGVWKRSFPASAKRVAAEGHSTRLRFMTELAEQVWPNKYLCHVLWRFITPFKLKKVLDVHPINKAPHLSPDQSRDLIARLSGLAAGDQLPGDEGHHSEVDIMRKCDEVMSHGQEFHGPSAIFERLYHEFDFVLSDWNLNSSADGGTPRMKRIVTNAVRRAKGRIDLHEGGSRDNAIDDSWAEMAAVEKIKGKILYRYVGRGAGPPDPVERALVSRLEDDDGSGFVYAFANDAWPGWVKIGMSVDWEARLESYQTSSPYRDYRKLGVTARVASREDAERHAHRITEESSKCEERRGEWFRVPESVALASLSATFDIHRLN